MLGKYFHEGKFWCNYSWSEIAVDQELAELFQLSLGLLWHIWIRRQIILKFHPRLTQHGFGCAMCILYRTTFLKNRYCFPNRVLVIRAHLQYLPQAVLLCLRYGIAVNRIDDHQGLFALVDVLGEEAPRFGVWLTHDTQQVILNLKCRPQRFDEVDHILHLIGRDRAVFEEDGYYSDTHPG